MSVDMEMQSFINAHLKKVKPLSIECGLAWWDNALTGSEEAAERAAQISSKLIKIYADPKTFEMLKDMDVRAFQDKMIARQHDLLLRAFQGEQMPEEMIDRMVALDKDVQQEYNNYRAEVRGECWTENDVHQCLRESDDSELRREAWLGSKGIGPRVAERVLELVRLRNQVAVEQGFPNYYTKSYTLDELDEERIFQIFDELAALTDPLWKEWKTEFDARESKRFGILPEEMRPWHYPDPFFQEPPGGELNLDRFYEGMNLELLTRKFYSAIGLPVDDIMEHSDLYEKPGKNQHAFCTDIDHEGDVRVLCNIRSNERWMSTMLHEFGHAVYDAYTDFKLPWMLRGPSHTLATEAIAELMGRFSSEGKWMRIYADVDEAEAAEIDKVAHKEHRVRFLILTRWMLTMCNFERAMYRNPEQDLNTLWWDMVEKYQGVRRPEDRNEPDWAAKLHLALAPAYYQNYLLGEMFAAQILQAILKEVNEGKPLDHLLTHRGFGEWLQKKIFLQGAVLPWEDGLKFATGETLNPVYFAQQLKP
jgi:peptidyl-dipeptidase A